jgi:hypothetical protein
MHIIMCLGTFNLWVTAERIRDGVSAHLAVLWEMFSVTAIMTEGYVKEDPLHGLHSRQIWILWIFTCEDTWKSLHMQLLLKTKRHIALWIPVTLSATALASLNGCCGPWFDVSRCKLNLMEDILITYYKCTLSAITQKLNISGQMLIWTVFLVFLCGTGV